MAQALRQKPAKADRICQHIAQALRQKLKN
jgi:hypothetical protein